MPSHIFTRVGAWQESAATNRRAYKAAIGGGELGEAYHASDYAVYADLQMARDADATSDIVNAFDVKVGAPLPFVVGLSVRRHAGTLRPGARRLAGCR